MLWATVEAVEAEVKDQTNQKTCSSLHAVHSCVHVLMALKSTANVQVSPEGGEEIFEVIVLCAVLCTLVVIPCTAVACYRDIYDHQQLQKRRAEIVENCRCDAKYQRHTTKDEGMKRFECAKCQRRVKQLNFYFWRCEHCSHGRSSGEGLELCFRCTKERFPKLKTPGKGARSGSSVSEQ
eukprot:symbB.v1.2.011082.t1/scaffold738.1/size167167/16